MAGKTKLERNPKTGMLEEVPDNSPDEVLGNDVPGDEENLPYFSLTGATKPLPYTKPIIHGIRGAIHGLLPSAEQHEANVATGLEKLRELATGEKGKTQEENEEIYKGQLAEAEEESPWITHGAEVVGAIYSPLNKLAPGLGQAGIAKGLVKGAGQLAWRGAEVGGLHGLADYVGRTKSDEQTGMDALKALTLGAGVGGAVGGVAGGFLGRAAYNKDKLLMQAAYSSASDLAAPGRAIGAKSPTRQLKKALDIAKGGERRGVLGNVGQDLQTQHSMVESLSNKVGKEGEMLRDALATKARKMGNPTFGEATQVKTEILREVSAEMRANGVNLVKPDIEALSNADDLLTSALGIRADGKATPVGLANVHNVYEQIGRIFRGQAGNKAFENSVEGQMLLRIEGKLKRIFRREGLKIDKDLTKQLIRADRDYHIFESLQTAAAQGLKKEVGATANLRGRIGSIAGHLLGRTFGPIGAATGYAIGGKATQRAVMPNTLLAMLKRAAETKKLSAVVGANARQATAPSSPSNLQNLYQD